jgi:hypothetical protein
MVHTPVSLRSRLARPLGESVGLFVGSADLRSRWRRRLGFWENARRFHRRLRRALRDPFRIFRLVSKAVSPEEARQLGEVMLQLLGGTRALAITNLGELDGGALRLESRGLRVESLSGAVTAVIDSSVLVVYTLDRRMRLELLASEIPPDPGAVQADADRAVQRLLRAAEVQAL